VSANTDDPDPYSRGAFIYLERGHRGVVPVDVDGVKGRTMTGFTGGANRGRYPTDEDVTAWVAAATLYPRNLGLRLPEDGVGLDVDDPEVFEEWTSRPAAGLPPLPRTWSSTSRGPTDERRKHVYRAELPPGRRWRKDGFPGGDLLHHGHRYVRCWPSVAPRTGDVELWYDPDGRACAELVPTAEELYAVELPPEWVEALTEPVAATPALDVAGNGDEFDWARWIGLSEIGPGEAEHHTGQDRLLFEAASSLAAQPGVSDRFALAHLRGLAQKFVNEDGREPWTDEQVVAKWQRARMERAARRLPEGYRGWVQDMALWQPPRLVEPEAEPLTDPAGAELDERVVRRVGDLAIEAQAREVFEELQLAQVRGNRPKRTAADFAELPQPAAVLESVLAAEVNLLGGPSEAGKSLLARDWALSVATGKAWRGHLPPEVRNVLWVASEGLHDFRERWAGQPGWGHAKDCAAACKAKHAADRVYVLDQPVNLVLGGDVDWLLKEYAAERPGLVVLDVIYGMGLTDENGMKDVAPVLSALKRISAEWGCATLALGHPGHNGERRFRGSSMWKQLAYTEWHLAEGSLTCEKSKLADKRRLGSRYRVEYPCLHWLDTSEALAEAAGRDALVRRDFELHPDDRDLPRARRLVAQLDVSQSTAQRLVRRYRAQRDDQNDG